MPTSPPADATNILNAVAAELATLYPAMANAIKIRKREAVGGRQQFGGWTEGFPLPCLVVSSEDGEPIDDYGTFEDVSVGYSVLVEYVKAVAAKVPSGDTPAEGAEDSDVRDFRAAIRFQLYSPQLTGLPVAINVVEVNKGIYELVGGGKALSSGQIFTYHVWEPRASD